MAQHEDRKETDPFPVGVGIAPPQGGPEAQQIHHGEDPPNSQETSCGQVRPLRIDWR